MTMAVALGGFGGFNLHGAGVLEALRRLDLRPDLFTVTSGQIVVLAEWLKGGDAKAFLLGHGGRPGPLRTLTTAVTGHAGVFRPAAAETLASWFTIPLTSAALAERLMPARQYVPVFSRESLAGVAATLEAAAVGVVFNTYDYQAGHGVLHANTAALARMPSDVELQPITAEAIESALWLYLYGFREAPQGRIDGAYHRSLILSELHGFDHVVAACPFPTDWGREAPSNSLEVEDWKVKQWFSNSYRAEVARLRKVIALVGKGTLNDPDYAIQSLIEIPIRSRWGYFDYFTEKEEVFEQAMADALVALAPYCAGAAARRPDPDIVPAAVPGAVAAQPRAPQAGLRARLASRLGLRGASRDEA